MNRLISTLWRDRRALFWGFVAGLTAISTLLFDILPNFVSGPLVVICMMALAAAKFEGQPGTDL